MSDEEKKYTARPRRGPAPPKERGQKHVRLTGKEQSAARREVAESHPEANRDSVDQEIEDAIAEGRPVDASKAFPYAPPKKGNARSRIDEPPVDIGNLPEEMFPPMRRPRQQPPGKDDAADDTGMSPKQRLQHVATVAPHYLEEYKLQLLHRLILRGLSLDVISGMLDVPMDTLYKWRKRLFSRLREEAKRVDIYLLAGKTLSFYGEIQAVSLRMASDGKQSARTRLEGLRTAMAAESLKNEFLAKAGFYEHVQFKPTDPDAVDKAPEQAKRTLSELNQMLGIEDPDDQLHGPEDDDDQTMLIWQ